MFEILDSQSKLTKRQWTIVGAAIAGDLLEFFDYYLIGFVLAYVVGPWKLTYGATAVILLSSGVGAILGAFFYGWLADRIGRRSVFMATVVNFAVATGALAFTPENGWLFLVVFRFLVGFGAGGLYCVDLPLVQEYVPTSMRGRIGGLVTAAVPCGLLLASLVTGILAPIIGWRGLFIVGAAPALLIVFVRAFVPESPRWLATQGRFEEARKSLAWALNRPIAEIPPPTAADSERSGKVAGTRFRDIFKHPRSLAVSWLSNLGIQTGSYGFTMWAPTLLVLLLHVSPAQASWLMVAVSLGGLLGRFLFSALSESIGRRASGSIFGIVAGIGLVAAAVNHDVFLGGISLFWLLLIVTNVFADGGFAIVGPYSAEVWPSRLRTTGMGSAYGFGGIGKVIGPLGLAMIVGSSNIVTPQASADAVVPAFIYLAGWYVFASLVFVFIGIETRGLSLESLEGALEPETIKRADHSDKVSALFSQDRQV